MAYTVLARKYRPKNFASLVGQDHVVRALTHALSTQRLHHAYLFTGTRGIGKTTLSRIFAKALNCEKGISAEPCGQCEVCRAIDEDRFIDYVELDAASNRGVADMEQLLEQAVYAPTAARFKIYMIDEVHMLSNQAFNAMLKTLEEPPEYVKFILATTDPQKIPVTVLSRCLQFNLKQMPMSQIADHLAYILDLEKIQYEKGALSLLAHSAYGSMRDALSLTDQAIAYSGADITTQTVRDMLGALDQTYLIRMLDALAEHDGKQLLSIANELGERGLSFRSALQDLATLFNKIAIIQTVPEFESDEWTEYDEIVRLSELFSPQEVQLNYQIAIMGANELGFAPDEYAGFTMTLLRMLAFVPSTEPSTIAVATEKQPPARPASQKITQTTSPQERNTIDNTEKKAEIKHGRTSQIQKIQQILASKKNSNVSRLQNKSPVEENKVLTQEVVQPHKVMSNEPDVVEDLSAKPVSHEINEKPKQANIVWDGNWQSFVRALPLKGMFQQMAYNAQLLSCENFDGVLKFHLRMYNEIFASSDNIKKLSDIFSQALGLKANITVELGQVENTLSQKIAEEQNLRKQQAQQHIENDIYINNLLTKFQGHIVNGSIKPIK